MYCKLCGALPSSTDRVCKICGTKLDGESPAESPESIEREAEILEEVVFNPPYEDETHHNRFYLIEDNPLEQAGEKEALKEYLSGEEVEAERKYESAGDDFQGRKPISSSEFNWDVHDFPKGRKTEEAVFNWNLEDFSKPEQKEAAAAFLEDELFREMRDESTRIKESNIDRFFTFSKKNEEFQKLLDKEYEKLRRHSHNSSNRDQEGSGGKAEPENNNIKFELETDSKFEPDGEFETETDFKFESTAALDSENILEEKGFSEVEFYSKPKLHTEEAQDEALSDSLIKDNESIIKKLEVMDPEAKGTADERVASEADERVASGLDALFGPISDAEPLIRETDLPVKATDLVFVAEPWSEKKEEPELEEETEFRTEQATDLYPEQDTKPELKQDTKPDPEQDIEPQFVKITKHDLEQEKESVREAEPQSAKEASIGAAWSVMNEDNRSSSKKRMTGQIVLIVIAVILALEIGILAIRYFAPGSEAANRIDRTQTSVINTVTGWFGGLFGSDSENLDQNKPEGEENDGTSGTLGQDGQPENPDKPEAQKPDPTPMADKAALIATQLYKNTNVEQIVHNDQLVFDSSKDYGITDLNNSKPIDNNIWMEKDGQTVYYDQSIVGTLIAFDSQWIDYVNNGNKAVLSLLKKDSPAYKNASGFSKIGKIKEAFKRLEIGEIRQGQNGFYVWAHEEIEIVEKGVTTAKKYNWIYYLEPVDGNLNIVNYFKFK